MKIIDEVYPLIKCEARLSDDGTLWIKTDTKSAEQTKRVLIEYAENSFCKTFYQDCDEPPTIPTFAESAEAYKEWTGEEMGKTIDEINDMNKDIIKDILKMMPTAYLLEALGVDTVDELMKPSDAVNTEKLKGMKFVAIKGDKTEEAYRAGWNGAIDCVIENVLSSADAVQGEWIDQHEDGHNYWVGTCNQCGKYSKEVGNYCPNCGADMRGEHGE